MGIARLRKNGVPAEFVDDLWKLPAMVAGKAETGDVVMTMGARDPDLPALARAVLEGLKR